MRNDACGHEAGRNGPIPCGPDPAGFGVKDEATRAWACDLTGTVRSLAYADEWGHGRWGRIGCDSVRAGRRWALPGIGLMTDLSLNPTHRPIPMGDGMVGWISSGIPILNRDWLYS